MNFDNKHKKRRWKNILGISSVILIGASSLTGIAFGSYNIVKNTNISNDFTEGRSFQLNLRLYKTNDQGNVLIDPNTKKPIPIYETTEKNEENIKKSAAGLNLILEKKGLTNIKVSYGYSTISNNQIDENKQPIFENYKEPVATLYATFENSQTAFNLKDIKDEVNDMFNDKNVFNTLTKSISYKLEVVKPSYTSQTYPIVNPNPQTIKNPEKTGRVQNSSILINEQNEPSDIKFFSSYDTNWLVDGKISPFVDKNGKESLVEVAFKLKVDANNGYNYFDSWSFGEQKKQYQEILRKEDTESGSSSDDSSSDQNSSPPKESQKYQTTHTWILWKDKQGLIDYLNSLIGIWYFNLYANKVNPIDWGKEKNEILTELFPTGDDPKYVRGNATYNPKRKQINTIIDNLSSDEKQFIAWAVETTKRGDDTMSWTPPLINENDLIPVLYNFYNSEKWSPSWKNLSDLPNDNPEGVSQSVKDGWWFLESNSTAMNGFLSNYLIGTIDYRNFNKYFEDPNEPKKPTDEDENPIPDPYKVRSFIIESESGYNAVEYADVLNNKSYKFPIVNNSTKQFVDNWSKFKQEYDELSNEWENVDPNLKPNQYNYSFINQEKILATKQKISLEEYNKKKELFANKNLNSNILFLNQFISPPLIQKSITTLNPLDVLLIIISAIVFMVGIFISIRYRIPGFLAFLMSGLVFILSSVLYNTFGFVYSFYSLLALAIGTFLSFITPFFIFRNTKKELSEGSTLLGALLKSIRKYWKLSLDTHVMSLLASLAFLFFGTINNINFGAMLVISVFLSFILSGVIFYILILFYVYIINFETNKWFLSSKTYLRYRSNDLLKTKQVLFLNKLNFFSKPSYFIFLVLFMIAIAGVILLGIKGPFFSLEFSNSNLLIINNFDIFGLTQDQIIKTLGINVINGEVYDNQLVLYTLNTLDFNSVLQSLINIPGLKNQDILSNNLLITELTYESSLRAVINALQCLGIAIGLCTIWSCLSLNIVSIFPLLLSQSLTIFTLVGLFGIIALPIDLNIIPIISFIFIINTAFNTSVLSAIKTSWNRSILIQKNDLKILINNIVSKINMNYNYIIFLIIIFAIFAIVLSSFSLLFSLLALVLGMIWTFFFNNRIVIVLWYYFLLLKDKFTNELLKSKRASANSKKDYDSVNEQKIIGINCKG